MRRQLGKANRVRQVAQVFVLHGFGGFVDQIGLADRALVTDAGDSRVVARFGRRLALAFSDLGPTFVKLGQLLATREDVLPAPVIAELRQLQDNVKPFGWRAARKQLESSLDAPLDDLFRAFDREPIAAGSIAQVYKAQRRQDGRGVVVKVRRPGIERKIEDDLMLLADLAALIEAKIPESRRYDPSGLVAEFAQNLRRELSFQTEAEHLERLGPIVAGTAVLPDVCEELSTDAVLTMTFLKGRRVTAVRGRRRREQAAEQIVACFAQQILRAGFFHGDPHPGNVLVLPSGELALLDFGAVGELTPAMRRVIFRCAAAGVRRDGAALASAMLDMAQQTEPVDRRAFEDDVGRFLDTVLGRPLGEVSGALVIGELFAVTRRYGLRIRSEYFVLMRATLILDGVLRELSPEMDLLRVSRKHVVSAMIVTGAWIPALRVGARLFRRKWRSDARFRKRVAWVSAAVFVLTALVGASVTLLHISA